MCHVGWVDATLSERLKDTTKFSLRKPSRNAQERGKTRYLPLRHFTMRLPNTLKNMP
jgi:hypothetical protein